ncbi:hypothetical protein JJB99_24685 [Bradyrhizobium diazoefficiens]|uniref:hypothetical protein n=1 Tax=Bradyrhizobium diazoefficiens TaxID=1355477 RepID=UPI00190DE887|nr:hypothetical protein [Bradyrhizobium diazoefficiens]QQO12639.1 hypothetical protein JJB99_24685 [Bradyrhizobium diazoefficiens]
MIIYSTSTIPIIRVQVQDVSFTNSHGTEIDESCARKNLNLVMPSEMMAAEPARIWRTMSQLTEEALQQAEGAPLGADPMHRLDRDRGGPKKSRKSTL